MRHPLRSARARLHLRLCFCFCCLRLLTACVLCTAPCAAWLLVFCALPAFACALPFACALCLVREPLCSAVDAGFERYRCPCAGGAAAYNPLWRHMLQGACYGHSIPAHCARTRCAHSVHNNCLPARYIRPLLTICTNCAIMEAHSIECQHGAGT